MLFGLKKIGKLPKMFELLYHLSAVLPWPDLLEG